MDSEDAGAMRRIPTRLDRYPAKMVSHLAECIVSRYSDGCTSLLDPFCGSGAILAAGSRHGLKVTGFDVNPYAALLASVKLNGFSPAVARRLHGVVLDIARSSDGRLAIAWDSKGYWFGPATIGKYEQLRYAARELRLGRSRAGRAVLLALALSARLCSRADQRSPKPFISKRATRERGGRHFDPYICTKHLLDELCELYGKEKFAAPAKVTHVDLTDAAGIPDSNHRYSHVMTSPPYINAQDYFRNFKLELYVLEGLIPFEVSDLKCRFIGTERGLLMRDISEADQEAHYCLIPELRTLGRASFRHAAIVHRYLHDMAKAIEAICKVITPTGTCVIVCGDNLVGGMHIRTWEALNMLMASSGFSLYDSFSDTIQSRIVPPKRQGHKGLIKCERISAFRRT